MTAVRTDLTALCSRCAVRMPRAERCPRCRKGPLHDLRSAKGRAAALDALGFHPKAKTRATARLYAALGVYLRYVAPAITVLAGVAVLLDEHDIWMGLAAAFVAFLLQVALMMSAFAISGLIALLFAIGKFVFLLFGGKTRVTPGAELPTVLLYEPKRLAFPTTSFSGRVRAAEPTVSPVGQRPCAAFRVAGQGPLGPIDDAGGTTFEIVGDDGELARVVLGSAHIDVPVPSAPVVVRPDATLTRFLEARGIFPERGPVRIAEGRLEDGDLVEVEGRSTEAAEPDGYRGHRTVRIFVEHEGAPLVVRKLDP